MKIITLTKGKVAYVDDEDFDRVNAHKWYASLDSRGTKWYAKRRPKKYEIVRWGTNPIRLHHFILDITPAELPPDHVVDHCNHDSLDCRRFIDGKIQLEIVPQSIITWLAQWAGKRK